MFIFEEGGIDDNKQFGNFINNSLNKYMLIVADFFDRQNAKNHDIQILRTGNDGSVVCNRLMFDDHFITNMWIFAGTIFPQFKMLTDGSLRCAVYNSD